MDNILQGLPGVICYLDDVLITGKTDEEHLANIEAVFARLEEYGIRLKLNKCAFMKESVQYLGHIIDRNGVHTCEAKIEALKSMPMPRNVGELRSFLGLINYYGKFVKNLASICKPLYQLLQKDIKWSWSQECSNAIEILKSKLSHAPVLVHYDAEVKLGLACDASSTGLGAVLFHIYSDGTEKPICYASKTLNKNPSTKYPQT